MKKTWFTKLNITKNNKLKIFCKKNFIIITIKGGSNFEPKYITGKNKNLLFSMEGLETLFCFSQTKRNFADTAFPIGANISFLCATYITFPSTSSYWLIGTLSV